MIGRWIAALFLAGCASTGSPETNGEVEEKLSMLDEAVPIWLEEHDVPSAVVAYIANGEIAFTKAWGERAPGKPATTETLYNVASLSKPIVAETVLRLADEGRVDLDEPLAAYWIDPDVKDDPRSRLLTARLVLKHETGLPNWRYQTDDVLRFIAEPGGAHNYSGEGFEWMAKAISSKLDTPFEELAHTYVLDEVGMPNTAFVRQPWFEGRLAEPYMKGKELENVVPETFIASDDMRTTVGDYARFLIDVMEGGDVSSALASERTTISRYWSWVDACATEDESDAFCPDRTGWSLGWMVFEYGDETIVMHSGGDWGEKTLAFFSPEREEGVVVFTNGAEGHSILHKVAEALYDNPDFAELMTP